MSKINVVDLDQELQQQSPQKILRYALEHYENIALSFSGAEDVALIDMVSRIRPDVQVFSLDTGRLHPETYRFIDQVRNHYGIKIEVLFPDAAAVQELVSKKGLF